MHDDTIERLVQAVKSLPKDDAQRLVKATIERLERAADADELAEMENEIARTITSATSFEILKQMLRGMIEAGKDPNDLRRQFEQALSNSGGGAR